MNCDKYIVASLTDIQPPSLRCPPDMEVSTETGQPYRVVSWQVPFPTDNSNEPLNFTSLRPPQQVHVGRTEIKYEATDSAGLKTTCVFSIHVRGKYGYLLAVIEAIEDLRMLI